MYVHFLDCEVPRDQHKAHHVMVTKKNLLTYQMNDL